MEMINATVGVYATHEKAVKAVKTLKDSDFDVSKVSIIGQVKFVEDHLKVLSGEHSTETGAVVGSVVGTILGVLSGLSMITIPGLGVLYAAGALVGAVGGFSVGTAGGGLIGTLLSIGIHKEGIIRYQKHLKEGKFLVVVHGSKTEADNAHQILDDTDHHEVEKH